MSSTEQFNDIAETLSLLENILLEAERCVRGGHVGTSLVAVMFRYAHNAKGAFGMLQIEPCQELLHDLESMLDRVRRGQAEMTLELVDTSLKAVSALRRYVEGEQETEDLSALERDFESMLARSDAAEPSQKRKSSFSISPEAKKALDSAIAAGRKTYLLNKLVAAQISQTAFEALPIFSDLKAAGADIVAVWPPHAEFDTSQEQIVIQILCTSSASLAELASNIFDPIFETEFHPIVTEKPADQPLRMEPPPTRFLIVEDEVVSRRILSHMLNPHGVCDVVVDGQEAIVSFILAIEEGRPYDMVFLDIRLPNLDGRSTLRFLRRIEEERGLHTRAPSRVVMTTALQDPKNVMGAFREGCEGYLVKPFKREKLEELLKKIKPSNVQGA